MAELSPHQCSQRAAAELEPTSGDTLVLAQNWHSGTEEICRTPLGRQLQYLGPLVHVA